MLELATFDKPGTGEYKHTLTFRVRRYVVIETKLCAPIADPPNNAQQECTPTIRPSYIRVRTVVWECGEGQTRHTDTQTAVTNRFGYA